jgi:hypothetical protein
MFIGHFGLGFGAKKVAPTLSLGTLFIAVQFLDLLWPTLLLLNIEHVALNPEGPVPLNFIDYPITHSLLTVIGWSILFGGMHWLVKRNTRNALILALAVFSHWAIDLTVHINDLPLYPGDSPKVGMGLWNFPIATALIESAIFIAGVVIYVRTTTPKNRSGKIGLWVLITLLSAAHLANIFGPVPTDVTAVAWSAQLQWVFVLAAYWTDRNRTSQS